MTDERRIELEYHAKEVASWFDILGGMFQQIGEAVVTDPFPELTGLLGNIGVW